MHSNTLTRWLSDLKEIPGSTIPSPLLKTFHGHLNPLGLLCEYHSQLYSGFKGWSQHEAKKQAPRGDVSPDTKLSAADFDLVETTLPGPCYLGRNFFPPDAVIRWLNRDDPNDWCTKEKLDHIAFLIAERKPLKDVISYIERVF